MPSPETGRRKGADPLTAGGLAGLYLSLGITALIVVVADQVSKQLALSRLADGPVDLIAGALTLRLTYNSGGAFGVLQGWPGLFLIATVVVVAVILLWVRRLEDPRWALPLGMVLGGGLGNVFDRIFRDTNGQVVDFIDLHWWPVFNLADASIVIGVGVVLILSARTRVRTGAG
jgi:signal peptidase II